MSRPRLVLADDHPIVAEGLRSLLTAEFEVADVVGDGLALLESVRVHRPEVVVADIQMPGLDGIAATARLRAEYPGIRVVILTMHREIAYARRALGAGASAFVLKVSAPSDLITAIRAALTGGTFVSPEIARDLDIPAHPSAGPGADPRSSFTPRQREILQFLAEGRTTKEIGAVLGISARTVEAHKYDLMRSAGLKTTAELIRLAIRIGLIQP